MKRNISIIILLGLMLQMMSTSFSPWIPDFLVIIVIFTSVFFGMFNGIVAGVIAGFFRGMVSLDMISVDIFIFPFIAFIANRISKLFYQQSPVVHMAITGVSMLILIVAHLVHLSMSSGNAVDIYMITLKSWRTIITSVMFAPLIFISLNKLFIQLEHENKNLR